MAKFGFLSVLEEELDKHLDYDFAMDWDKKNHAVEVTFILEAMWRLLMIRVKCLMKMSFLKTTCSFTIQQNHVLMKRTT